LQVVQDMSLLATSRSMPILFKTMSSKSLFFFLADQSLDLSFLFHQTFRRNPSNKTRSMITKMSSLPILWSSKTRFQKFETPSLLSV
jgi:hypothetical protein